MTKLIKQSVVEQLWYFLYPRIKLTLFISIATYKVLIPICEEPSCQVSVEARLWSCCFAVCTLLEARNFLLSQNIWTFLSDHPNPCAMGNGASYLGVKW
jgi:hypothetical protein